MRALWSMEDRLERTFSFLPFRSMGKRKGKKTCLCYSAVEEHFSSFFSAGVGHQRSAIRLYSAAHFNVRGLNRIGRLLFGHVTSAHST